MTYRIIPDPEVSGIKLVSNFFKRSAGPLNWPETFNLSAVIRLTPSGAPTGRAFIELRPSRLPPVPDFYWLSTLIAFPTTFRTPVPE